MTMDDDPLRRLQSARQLYAQQVLAKAGVAANASLEHAFGHVPRETFIGPPPWLYSDFGHYRELASADPAMLYQDVLVGLKAERGINNGMPSLHAAALHALAIREGETVVHLGCGSGYYTAIIAELVGSSGRVIAVEHDGELAENALRNLAAYPQVKVRCGNALDYPQEDADVVYANFALDHVPLRWIDALAPSGRLLFPLGVPAIDEGRSAGHSRWAAFLMIDRRRGSRFGARFLKPVSFVWGEGMTPPPIGRHAALGEAFRGRRLNQVRSFRRGAGLRTAEWYGEGDWGLSFEEP